MGCWRDQIEYNRVDASKLYYEVSNMEQEWQTIIRRSSRSIVFFLAFENLYSYTKQVLKQSSYFLK
jgi:hypothetical protein